MRAVFVGVGAVGARAARQLIFLGSLDELVVVDAMPGRAEAVAQSLGPPARAHGGPGPDAAEEGDVVVLGVPTSLRPLAEAALARGAHVVSVSDATFEVQQLLDLDGEAQRGGLHVVVGAGFSPGLSCVLAALAARSFQRVSEVHLSKVGAGGPACAAQHQAALAGHATDWRDGSWERGRGGSGRALCWFPDPVRGVDCYRADLPEPMLLHAAFPDAQRVTARLGRTLATGVASRAVAGLRSALVSRLPALRRPDPEGDLGGIRVEVRGTQGTAHDDRVLGAVDRPAVAAGAVAAMAARWVLDGRLARTGAAGLAELVEPGPFLAALAERGVKVAVFEGGQHGDAPPVRHGVQATPAGGQ